MIGKKISHYKILEKIGEGGMGVVYKAEDTKLKRRVALKFLPSHLLQEEEHKLRFLLEAQTAAALDHPNICVVHEIKEVDSQFFISMALIKGQNLKKIISESEFDPNKTLDIAIQIAQGLEEAHEKKIVHRDIKPSNIMITAKGRALILDFGIAKLTRDVDATQTAGISGTLAYMSPEQLMGRFVDHRTDIWSLGVVLYEMLTRTHPFASKNEKSMFIRILEGEFEPIPKINSKVSIELERVIRKAIASDVNKRYESVSDLLNDLVAIRSGNPISLPREGIEKTSKSVAVLDFANIAKVQDFNWLSGGIAESVTVDLKKISALQVVSREKVLKALASLGGTQITEQQVIDLGQALNVRWILWGAFQKMGDTIRITAHFTEVTTGDLIGSAKVDGAMNDIFKLQDRIITNLMDSLQLKLSYTEIQKIQTPETAELEAYEYHAKGKLLHIQMGKEGISEAIKLMLKAIEIDPEYALAYSGLGSIFMTKFIAQTNPDDLEKGISYLQQALNLDPDLVDPYLWLTYGNTRKRNFEEAIHAGRRAVQLEPDNPLSHYFLGLACHVRAAEEYTTENYREAVEHYFTNIKLQPNYQPAFMNIAWIYFLHGQYKEAKKCLERAVFIEESGKLTMVKFVGALTLMGDLCFRLDQLDAAWEWYQKSLSLLEKSDHVYKIPFIALTHNGLGRILLHRCRYDASIKHYKEAHALIARNPKSLGSGYFMIMSHLGLARAYYHLAMMRESKQHFQKAEILLHEKRSFDFNWIWQGSNAQIYFEIAGYNSLAQLVDKAFESLKKAVACGWAEWPLLEQDDCFETIRDRPEYFEIIRDLKTREPLP